MGFRRFNFQLVLRVILLVISISMIVWLLMEKNLWFTTSGLIILCLIQVYEMSNFVNRTNRELAKFLYAVKYEDYSVTFKLPGRGAGFKHLELGFNEIIEKLRNARLEKESQFELLKMLLEKINVGIMVIDHHEQITVMNKAATGYLNTPNPKYWERMKSRQPHFCRMVDQQRSGGRKLVEVDDMGRIRELSLDVNPVMLNNQKLWIISFQDIKDEIEQKELDAWLKLIRILTHEIMNSVTPVSSLTGTMLGLLQDRDGHPRKPEDLDQEDVEDLAEALQTIHRRSQGMLDFVNDYRRLTQIPAPTFEMVRICDLFSDIGKLMEGEFRKKGVSVSMECSNKKLTVRCDRKLIEQVLINLLTNSLYAIRETEEPKITLSTAVTEKRILVRVTDNGAGVPREKLSRIFIPFYSTKPDGTGIGLSLSKNILRDHGGQINVESEIGKWTTFELSFPNPVHEN
ncbi:MAG: ATP-binding protein [Bacteroidota bacterium]|nr:ATP-binding protein [Bacteroidota bacterium]